MSKGSIHWGDTLLLSKLLTRSMGRLRPAYVNLSRSVELFLRGLVGRWQCRFSILTCNRPHSVMQRQQPICGTFAKYLVLIPASLFFVAVPRGLSRNKRAASESHLSYIVFSDRLPAFVPQILALILYRIQNNVTFLLSLRGFLSIVELNCGKLWYLLLM